MNYEEWDKALITGNITKTQVEMIKEKMEELVKTLDFFNALVPDPDYIPNYGYEQDEDFDWEKDEEKETNRFYISLFREYYSFNIIEN